MMQKVYVTSAQLADFAKESGRPVERGEDKQYLQLGSHLFIAPLPIVIPAQRTGDDQ